MQSEPSWALQGSFPPRDGNELTLFVDGEEGFSAVHEALQGARDSIAATFTYVSLSFRAKPDGVSPTLFELLAQKARDGLDVRVIIWDPATSLRGTIANPAHELSGTNAGPGSIQIRWDRAKGKWPWPAVTGCHHQKIFVLDGRIAFLGGLNSYQPYWDTASHDPLDDRRIPAELPRPVTEDVRTLYPPLHDLYAKIEGPCAQDLASNFADRWMAATFPHGTPDMPLTPQPPRKATHPVQLQIVRTLPPGVYSARPGGETSIQEVYLRAINAAKTSIYFENLYYFDRPVEKALTNAARRGVKIVGLLTRHPDPRTGHGFAEGLVEWVNEHKLAWGAPFRHENVGLFCPAVSAPDPTHAGSHRTVDIYVHAKLLMVDDSFFTFGSANISLPSMQFHTEINLVCNDGALAVGLKRRLWTEHFQRPLSEQVLTDPGEGSHLWQAESERNQAQVEKHLPIQSRILPLISPPRSWMSWLRGRR